jgi:predicted amidohydrolase YtcJ
MSNLNLRGLRAAAWLSLFAPMALAAAAEPAAVTVYYNARVFTAEPAAPYANAVAVAGERILAVGERGAVEAAAGKGAQHVDLQGRFLMPGMIDAHAHPIQGGMGLVLANYPKKHHPVAELLQFVDEEQKKGTSRLGEVLVVHNVDIDVWSHTAELEAALSQGAWARRPVVLFGEDEHTAWANAEVRRRYGITTEFLRGMAPADRRYYGYEGDLVPNGFVVDAGLSRLDSLLPRPSPELALAAGRAAMHYMNSNGITAWLDAAASGVVGGDRPATLEEPGYFPMYAELARRGELTAHVAAYPVIHPDSGLAQLDVVQAFQRKYKDVPNLVIPGLKVFADGVVEFPSQTASLTRPYLNNGRDTPLLFDPARFNELVTEADRRGLAVHIHAIGDRAVKASLDAYAAARRAHPDSRLPHTMTHLQFVDDEDLPRFAELRIKAAMQLLWAVADPSTNEDVRPYIDPAIYRTMYPARALLEAGTLIAGASDWPVSTANPFYAIYQAETRVGPQGVLDPAQRMPRMAMLYAYTRNAAQVVDQLDQIGSLAPGKRADLVLLDRDVLTVPPAEMRDAKVLWTMLGGKKVYEAEQ